jgi:hypothetical protein
VARRRKLGFLGGVLGAACLSATSSAATPDVDPLEPAFTARTGSEGYPNFKGRRVMLRHRIQLLHEEGGRGSARRARMLGQWDHSPWLRTAFQFDMRTNRPTPLDWVLRWRNHDSFRVWVGQFKAPVSRSILSSATNLSFVDRSLAVSTFLEANPVGANARGIARLPGHGLGRAPGIQVWGDLDPKENSRLRYYVHATPGLRRNRFGSEWAGSVRLELQPRGDTGFQETTYRNRPFRWSLDAGVHVAPGYGEVDMDGDGLRSALDDFDRSLWTLGGALRYRRLRVQGEMLGQRLEPRAPAQASWLLKVRRWQLATRFSEVTPDTTREDQDRHEWTAAVTRYIGTRARKWMLEWRRRRDEALASRSERLVRLFFQFQW